MAMVIKRTLIGLIFLGTYLFAQPNPDVLARFTTSKTTALTAAAEILTVQHQSTQNKIIEMKNAYAYCSVACTVTLERDGTVASSTANTIVNVNPGNANAATSQALAFNTSNVGVGSVLNTYQISAGGWVSIDLSYINLAARQSGNITLRTNSITGTVQLMFLWVEK